MIEIKIKLNQKVYVDFVILDMIFASGLIFLSWSICPKMYKKKKKPYKKYNNFNKMEILTE